MRRGWLAVLGLVAMVATACGDASDESESAALGGAAGTSAEDGGLGGAAGGSWAGASGMGGGAGAAGGTAAVGGAAGQPGDAGGVDATTPADPCTGADDGKYCGGVLGADKQSLYTCGGGLTTSDKVCANGCFNGTYQDKCKANCCLAKPPGSIPTNGGWNDCPYSGSGRQHMAIDFTSPLGTPIPAGMDAVVQYIRYKGDPKCYANGTCTQACLLSGDYIVIKAVCGDPKKPANDLYVRYHHINQVKKGLKVGDKVGRGETIAFVGQSGCATGPHVHLMTASFKQGSYKVGEDPPFWSCSTSVNPATRFCN